MAKNARAKRKAIHHAEQRWVNDPVLRTLHPEKAEEERGLRQAQVQRQRDWGHKVHGTTETHAKAAAIRQGALARLYQSGAIDIQQLEAAHEIAAEVERIAADVTVKTPNLEPRIDQGRSGANMAYESLGRVRREVAYTRWRSIVALSNGAMGAAPVLAMIVDDMGIVAAARQFGMHRRRAKRMLIEAMDLWMRMLGDAFRDIDEDDVAKVERRMR